MRLRALCLVTVFGLLVSSSAGQDKAGTGDKEKLQGTWSMVSAKENGKDSPAEMTKGVKLVFAGDKLTITMNVKDKEQKMEWTYKIDPSKKPKEMDVKMEDGKIGTGIYEFDGDMLKIAHGETGDPRPKDFASKEGSKVTTMVLKRAKADKK